MVTLAGQRFLCTSLNVHGCFSPSQRVLYQYIIVVYCSNGPQKCNACIKEDIFEEPMSILKQGCVSMNVFYPKGIYL